MSTTDADGLGATLRRWRDRVSPEEAGLPAGRGRRAKGLRREELAALAGLSVDYVVRLEQGRAGHPSAQVVAALARALRLDADQDEHLHLLAGLRPPAARSVPRVVAPGVRRLLRRLGDAPASVFAADWTLLWWNPAWAALLGEPGPGRLNFIRRRFPVRGAVPADGTVLVESSDAAGTDRTFVADLRRALARYPGDPELLALVAETRAGNSRFAALWDQGLVGRHREDRKTIHHPEAGPLTLDCDVLLDEEHDQRIVLYTAEPGSREEELLRGLTDRAARAPETAVRGTGGTSRHE
ncbi:helix-turn-helix domain-containing protein [Streptomyces sp. NPDC088674]|uniref:helix-turn-helix domain-containing protein n=1 Tax=Streptomyces sp. NPDC088674 TaxID=3365869 RepID=UPI00380FC3EA